MFSAKILKLCVFMALACIKITLTVPLEGIIINWTSDPHNITIQCYRQGVATPIHATFNQNYRFFYFVRRIDHNTHHVKLYDIGSHKCILDVNINGGFGSRFNPTANSFQIISFNHWLPLATIYTSLGAPTAVRALTDNQRQVMRYSYQLPTILV